MKRNTLPHKLYITHDKNAYFRQGGYVFGGICLLVRIMLNTTEAIFTKFSENMEHGP